MKRNVRCSSKIASNSMNECHPAWLQCHKIPIPLYDILSVDEDRMTVTVEPMVTVGDITR